MSFSSKLNDILFLAVVAYHVYNRQWPWGDTTQTILDVVLLITGLLIAVKYYILVRK